jgi:hypothetical protein
MTPESVVNDTLGSLSCGRIYRQTGNNGAKLP